MMLVLTLARRAMVMIMKTMAIMIMLTIIGKKCRMVTVILNDIANDNYSDEITA